MPTINVSAVERSRFLRVGSGGGAAGPPEPLNLVDTILSLSPLGYWKLDEVSGTNANDSSPNNRDGTYVVGPGTLTLAAVAGPAGTGNYPQFNNGGQVTIADDNVWSLGASTGLTWFALIKPESVAADHQILTKGAGSNTWEWEITLGTGGAGEFDFFLYVLSNAAAKRWTWATPPLTAGAWQAIAVSVDSNNGASAASLYRNGGTDLAAGSAPAAGTTGAATAAVSIGWRADSPSSARAFDGGIAHVAIFAGELSSGSIGTIMDAADVEGWF